MIDNISEEVKELLTDVQRFCEEYIKEASKQFDKSGEWPEKIYEMAAELGYHSMEIPEAFGGIGLSHTDTAALLEEIAAADAGVAVTLAASNLAAKPILLYGNEQQKKKICDMILDGGYGAFCLTEPQAGSDAGACKTSALETKDAYILNGHKCFVTNGGRARFYCVAAVTETALPKQKISLFLVESSRQGVYHEGHEDKMGIRLSETCDVIFEDCRIPKENLIGIHGDGLKMAMTALNEARAMMAAAAVGIARRSMEEAVVYARQRKQFGHPLIDYQAIQLKIAEMDIRTETARQMAMYALRCADKGIDCTKEAAAAKCCAAGAAVKNALEAIQIMGGYGYSREFPAEKLLRDAKIFQIFEGTDEMMKLTIAKKVIKP